MATVLSQWVYNFETNDLPLTDGRKNSVDFVTGAVWIVLHEQKWKPLWDIIEVLYQELPKISGLTLSVPDQNGNIIATLGDDIRLALALGITNTQANNIMLFGRKEGEKEYNADGNKNPNLDLVVAAKAILSKWSTAFKPGNDYLDEVVNQIAFTWKYAYEQTDGQGDSEYIIMPVFAWTTASQIQIPQDKKIKTVSVEKFVQMKPVELTAKAEAYRQYVTKTLQG